MIIWDNDAIIRSLLEITYTSVQRIFTSLEESGRNDPHSSGSFSLQLHPSRKKHFHCEITYKHWVGNAGLRGRQSLLGLSPLQMANFELLFTGALMEQIGLIHGGWVISSV